MITYAPAITVHPDRYGADRSGQSPMVKWLILHTSEQSGAEDDSDAEDLARYLTSPGDRPSSSGGRFGASYHAITDTDRVIPCTPDHRVAYAAGGANRDGLHLCLPVRIRPRSTNDPSANTTRDRWLDEGSRGYIRQAAEWIVDKAREHQIPLRRITPEQMRAGEHGYCDHWTASLAFGKSDHTDCGPHFPWDVLADDITTITTRPAPPPAVDLEEDDMHLFAKPPRLDPIDLAAGERRLIPLPFGADFAQVYMQVQALPAPGRDGKIGGGFIRFVPPSVTDAVHNDLGWVPGQTFEQIPVWCLVEHGSIVVEAGPNPCRVIIDLKGYTVAPKAA